MPRCLAEDAGPRGQLDSHAAAADSLKAKTDDLDCVLLTRCRLQCTQETVAIMDKMADERRIRRTRGAWQAPASKSRLQWMKFVGHRRPISRKGEQGARGRQKRPGSHRRPFLASQAPRGTGHAPGDNLEALTRPDLIPLSTEALEHAESTGTLRTASVALAP